MEEGHSLKWGPRTRDLGSHDPGHRTPEPVTRDLELRTKGPVKQNPRPETPDPRIPGTRTGTWDPEPQKPTLWTLCLWNFSTFAFKMMLNVNKISLHEAYILQHAFSFPCHYLEIWLLTDLQTKMSKSNKLLQKYFTYKDNWIFLRFCFLKFSERFWVL